MYLGAIPQRAFFICDTQDCEIYVVFNWQPVKFLQSRGYVLCLRDAQGEPGCKIHGQLEFVQLGSREAV